MRRSLRVLLAQVTIISIYTAAMGAATAVLVSRDPIVVGRVMALTALAVALVVEAKRRGYYR